MGFRKFVAVPKFFWKIKKYQVCTCIKISQELQLIFKAKISLDEVVKTQIKIIKLTINPK